MRTVQYVIAGCLLTVFAADVAGRNPRSPASRPRIGNAPGTPGAPSVANDSTGKVAQPTVSTESESANDKISIINKEPDIRQQHKNVSDESQVSVAASFENNSKTAEEIVKISDGSVKADTIHASPDVIKEGNTTASSQKDVANASSPGEQRVNYAGFKVVRVALRNKQQKKLIKALEDKGDIETWVGNGTAFDILVRRDGVLDFLKGKNFSYDVVLDDLQRAIDEENPPLEEDEWSDLEGRKGHRMTWQMYHRMADIHGYLDYLTTAYPDTCSLETIGYSVEKKPLKVLKISSGKQNGKAIWVDSGIHAREWITPATSTYAISQMVENGDGTHGVDWYFLPLVNPDGYEHTHTIDRLWRKNRANPQKGPCAGTDLNRNFGYRWGGQGSSQLPCRETYAGSGPFSEPETHAIRDFVLSKSGDIKAYVSLHSYGQYILYPWGYDRKVPPDYSDLHRVGRAMAQAMYNSGGQNYKVGSSAATLYPAAGGSDDWAKGTAKIKYAYTIELRDTGRHGFILPAQYIQPTAREAYAALKILAKEILQP